ncbi:MAG: hypothetical protein Q9167_003347 [Letrouitia subvulpina]
MDIVSLQPVDLTDFTDLERAIFVILRATLHYLSTPQTKSAKIADDIIFFCKAQDIALGSILWQVWSVLIEIIYFIPSDHEWQYSLVQALVILRQLADPIVDNGKVRNGRSLVHITANVTVISASFVERPALPINLRERGLEWFDSDPLYRFLQRTTDAALKILPNPAKNHVQSSRSGKT